MFAKEVKKLLAGKRVFNPVVQWFGPYDERWGIRLIPPFIIKPKLKKNQELYIDFDTDEMYIKTVK